MQPVRQPEIIALEPEAPPLGELFLFMRDAELRFESVRMRIIDRTFNALGETRQSVEVWLRHPGHAKVTTGFDTGPGGDSALRKNFRVWVTNSGEIQIYDSVSNTTSRRPALGAPRGTDDRSLPAFGRVYTPLTDLPHGSVADTFIHPHGFCRNVLTTGPASILGTVRTAGEREAFLLRVDHPRRAEVLNDRPDRWLEVAVDRMSGIILLLVEHVGDRVTRHADVEHLELDAPIADDAFRIFASQGTARIF